MKYYVYQAVGLNNEILYIGKGSGDRYKHCNSGVSHCFELNRYFFEYGADSIHVEIEKYFETNEDALSYEDEMIITQNPLFNKKSPTSNQASYMRDAQDFYNSFELKLISSGLKLHAPHHIVWMNNMKNFVKKIGYKNLKEGLVLSRASVRNYRDDNLYNIFVRLLKGEVNSIFSTSFYIEKLDNKGMYFVKLVAQLT